MLLYIIVEMCLTSYLSFGVLSLPTSLLCIVRELAGGGFVVVAVGVGNRCHVTSDI